MNQGKDKNRKIMLTIIGISVLVIGLIGVTYAFFNYTRTGTRNVIKVGRIYFNSEQGTAINLTNMFPIDVSNGIPNDNTKVGTVTINVVGDTTYDDGVEYLVSAVNVENSVGSKSLPISIDVSYSANGNGKVIGTEEDNYFTNRGGNSSVYKVLANDTISSDDQLVVGYITKGSTGIDGNIVIRAYLDKSKIAISDTYPEEETDTNSDGYLDGTTSAWVNDRVYFTTTEWNSLQEDGVSFQIKVEANEGIWVEEPPKSAYETVTENVMTPTNLIDFSQISSSSNGEGLYILPGTENDTNPIYYYRGNINNNNVIFGDYCWQMVRTTDTGGIKMIYNGAVTGNGETCENTAHDDRVISANSFNSQSSTMADVGYMKNARYTYNSGKTSGAIYGKNIEWDGTNYLVIEDTSNVASTNTTIDDNHHYSCGTQGTTSCASVRYYYYYDPEYNDVFYITLTNGEKVEDALYKMTGNGDTVTKSRNASYVLNQNDSAAKVSIESWFRTNLTNEVDNTKRNYVSYLEDTVYCNDRSFKTVGNTYVSTYERSGWNPNGGHLLSILHFGIWNRFNNNWYSTTNVPSLVCPNETDRFSVSNSVAHLNYPVGLLTADEMIMAGAAGSDYAMNQTYYLRTGTITLGLSPSFFNYDYAAQFGVSNGLMDNFVSNSFGLRPVVSLKSGTSFVSGGNGTPTNPYVVKYN